MKRYLGLLGLLVAACGDEGFVFSSSAAAGGGGDGAGGASSSAGGEAGAGGDVAGVGGAGGAPEPAPSCDDGLENGDEAGVDCGGEGCGACPPDGCEYPHQYAGCDALYLSDFCPSAERNVDGCVRRDEEINYVAMGILIDGVLYDHGVGMHAPPFGGVPNDDTCKFYDESLPYEEGRAKGRWVLGGGFATFSALLGLAMNSPEEPTGEVVFIVRGDGVELGVSDPVDGGAPVAMEVDVSGVSELELVVDANGGAIDDRAVWADATLVPARCP